MSHYYEWKDDYLLNIPSIDEQHKHFFEIVNAIIKINEQETVSKEEVLNAITELGNYALYHLETEEKYFTQNGYNMAAAHIGIHNRFRETIAELIKSSGADNADYKALSSRIAQFSGDWLSSHILEMDRLYAHFFIEKGVS